MRTIKPPSPWLTALAGLLCLVIAMGISRFLLTPMLPVMQRAQGLSLVSGAWLAAATNIGYLIGALSCLALKQRPIALLRAGVLIAALFTLAMGLTEQQPAWLLFRFLIGAASAWIMVYGTALVTAQLHRVGSTRLDGVFFAGTGVGIAVTGVLVPMLASLQFGPGAIWIGFGAVAALLLVPIWLQVKEVPAAASTPTTGPALPPGALPLIIAYGLIGFSYAIPATFLPLIARQLLQVPVLADRLWPLYGVAAAVTTLVLPHIGLPPKGNRPALGVCQLGMLIGILLCLSWPGVASVTIATLLLGSALMAVVMLTMREAHRIAVGSATALVAALTSAFGLGQIVGPVVAGYAAEHSGSFIGALWIAVAALLIGLVAALWPERTTPR